MRFLLSILVMLCVSSVSLAQEVEEMQVPKATAFQSSLGKAIRQARKKKAMSVGQSIKLRVALLSPSFRKQAEELAVTQMAFSEMSGELPRTESGKVDRSKIDWNGFADFLERLLPILLQLIDMFAVNSAPMGAIA